MKKEFVEINNFNNYEISEDGKVRSIATKKYKKLCQDKKGRAVVVLTDESTGYAISLYIQDLIKEMFGEDACKAYIVESGEVEYGDYDSIFAQYQELAAKVDATNESAASAVSTTAPKTNKRCKKLRCDQTGVTYKSFAAAAKEFKAPYDKFYDSIYNRGNFQGYTFTRI